MKYKYKNMEKVLIHNHDYDEFKKEIFLGIIRGRYYNPSEDDVYWIVQWISRPKYFINYDCYLINDRDLTPLSTED